MSYRDRNRLSGYRSQPVSNRTSLYLSSDFNVGLTEDLTDFDRQFKKLLERTETFTNRVERLHSTSSYLKKGFRGVDTSLTRLRKERDVIGTSYGNLEHRIFNEDDQTTEEEWKRLLDAGRLIEKAVELVRQRYRYPKPVYEYSPESPSPQAYEVPAGTKLLPNPKSPRDREGKRIRDLGSEIKDHDTTSIIPTATVVAPTSTNIIVTTKDTVPKKDVTATTDVSATNGTTASNVQRDRDRPPSAKRIKKTDNEKSKSLQSLKEIDEEPDIVIEKPNIRARLASQKSKDEQKSDNDSKRTSSIETKSTSESKTTSKSISTSESKSTADIKLTSEKVDTPTLRRVKTIEERRQSIKSLMETDSLDKEETPSRTNTSEEKRLPTKSSFDSESRSTTQTPEPVVTRLGRTLEERRGSIKSLGATDSPTKSAASINDKTTSSISDVGKSTSTMDDSRFTTTDSYSSLRSNLSHSTHSLYSSSDRYKTRSERLLESERSDRYKDYSSPERTRSSAFRSESVFAERNDKENDVSMHEDDDDKSKDTRRPSLFKTLKNAASRSKKRPPSSIYEDTLSVRREQDQKKSFLSPEIDEEPIRRKSTDHLMYTNAELIKMAQEDLEKGKGKKKQEESVTPTTKKKTLSSSSFHEYHPDKRVPLKERLKNKMSETSTSTDDDSSTSTPISQRTSRLSRDKTNEKDDSLRSRFLRRFRLGSEEKGEEKKEGSERRSRKKSNQDEESAAKAKGKRHEEKKDEEEEESGKKSSRYTVDSIDPSKYDTYSTRAMKLSMEHRLNSIDLEADKKKAADTSLASLLKQEEEKINVDMSKYNVYSYKSRQRLKDWDDNRATRSPRYERERQKSTDSVDTPKKRSRTTSTREEKSDKSDKSDKYSTKNTDDSKDTKTQKDTKSDNKSPMSIRERNKNKESLKEPEPQFARFDLPSPKGIARRINPTYSFDQKKKDTESMKEITKLDLLDLDRRSLFVNEEVIRPVVKSEEIKMEFKSPRTSVSDEVVEEILASTNKTDQPIKDDFFKVLLQREVSEEEVSVVGATNEQPVQLDNLFDQLNQLPSVRSSIASSGDGRNRESASSEISTSENNKSLTTSFDEFSDGSDVFANGSRNSSSTDLFAKIEKANDKLYTGLLNLTTKAKNDDSDTTVHDSDGGNGGNKDGTGKDEKTSNVEETSEQEKAELKEQTNNDTCNLESSDRHTGAAIGDLPSEEVTVVDSVSDDKPIAIELKSDPSEVIVQPEQIVDTEATFDLSLHEEKFDHSPFKLTRTKKIDDNTPVTNTKGEGEKKLTKVASFDKAVDETAEDVNKMLSNCNSIDKISNDLQRSYTPTAKSIEDLSNEVIERSQSASPNRKRLSYLEKRASHMKLFQCGLSTSNEDVRSDSNSNKSSKESFDGDVARNGEREDEAVMRDTMIKMDEMLLQVATTVNGDTAYDKAEEDEDIVNEIITSSPTVESTLLDEIIDTVDENITLEQLSIKIPDENSRIEGNKNEMNSDKTKNIEKNSNNEINDENQFSHPNMENRPHLSSSKSLDADSAVENGVISNRDKMVAMRTTQSVEVKSLDEIRTRLDEIKTSSATSLVNVNVSAEGKSQSELKSLDQIKSRLEQIKARKKQLKLAEINKNLTSSKEAGITPQVTDVQISQHRVSVEKESDDSNIEENYNMNIPMSPIRRIKLSNDFLEESDSDVHQIENGNDTENDKVFFDDGEVLVDNKSSTLTNGHAAVVIPLTKSESDVKESVDEMLNEVVADSNENKRKNEIIKESQNTEQKKDEEKKQKNGVVETSLDEQNGQKNSNETDVKKVNDSSVNTTGLVETEATKVNGEASKGCVNGHTKTHLHTKESAEHSSASISPLGNSDANFDSSTVSESQTTSPKTKENTENGHSPLPKIPKFTFPRQMSIVEYRRKKLEKTPSEPLFNQSDEETPHIKSDPDPDYVKEHKSSVADVSDASDDCRVRKKYYRHSKKEINNSGGSSRSFRSSASEDSDEEDVSLVDHLANRFLQRTRGGSTGTSRSLDFDSTELLNRSTDPSLRSKNHTQKERYKANGNV